MLGPGVKRVEPDGTAGPECHRSHPPCVGQVAVLALGVDHPGPATEHGLAPKERLDEGALAPTDLPEDHHVRVGNDALGVELEGVEHEGSAQEVVTDDHASAAQPSLGNEGVGRPQVAGRDSDGPGAVVVVPSSGENGRGPVIPLRYFCSVAAAVIGGEEGGH